MTTDYDFKSVSVIPNEKIEPNSPILSSEVKLDTYIKQSKDSNSIYCYVIDKYDHSIMLKNKTFHIIRTFYELLMNFLTASLTSAQCQ